MFDTTREDLKDILTRAASGQLQLPEFQRSYVWDEEDVVSLIASVAKGFPVGALLTLEAGGQVRFKPRPIEGAAVNGIEPDELLLDGQQRVTSLFQSMFSESPVQTRTPKGKAIKRYFYLDMHKATDPTADIQDAIVSVPEDRIVRSNFGNNIVLDVSSEEKEFANNLFPLNRAFDYVQWAFGWQAYQNQLGGDAGSAINTVQQFFTAGVVNAISTYKMPVIRLDKNNRREAICLVFEKVNVGGKKLDAFELVTAIYAADNFNLREDWDGDGANQLGRRARMVGVQNPRDVLAGIASTDFLQSATLIHTREARLVKKAPGVADKDLPQISCNREYLLGLPLDAYRTHADDVEQGFVSAAKFLNAQKIIGRKDVPYPPTVIVLASVFAIMGNAAQTAAAREKLAKWFWSVTLGELYGSTTESRLARDVPDLVDWIAGTGQTPRSLDEVIFQKERLDTLRTRQSAAYKGIHALLMRAGCRDFITGQATDIMTFFNDDIDIHHVFPQAWCKARRISPDIFDSVVNKTALSKGSNIAIGGQAPSVYLRRIERQHGLSEDQLDEILRSHLIEPAHLRNDDFDAFMADRRAQLCGLIEGAMGKPVV